MSIITISRGSYSRGKEIAEKVATRLGYTCIARDVLLDASERFSTPEIKLIRAIHDAPSILDRFGLSKEAYIAYIETALLNRVKDGNAVYHGLAGHFFLKGISHVLKVRIIADLEERIKYEMEREKISREKALKVLREDDEQRRTWSLELYGIDTWDAHLYDLIIHIGQITTDMATEIICETVSSKAFQPTPESEERLLDLLLAAKVKSALVNLVPDVKVTSKQGNVVVEVEAPRRQDNSVRREFTQLAMSVDGVQKVEIKVSPGVEYI